MGLPKIFIPFLMPPAAIHLHLHIFSALARSRSELMNWFIEEVRTAANLGICCSYSFTARQKSMKLNSPTQWYILDNSYFVIFIKLKNATMLELKARFIDIRWLSTFMQAGKNEKILVNMLNVLNGNGLNNMVGVLFLSLFLFPHFLPLR